MKDENGFQREAILLFPMAETFIFFPNCWIMVFPMVSY